MAFVVCSGASEGGVIMLVAHSTPLIFASAPTTPIMGQLVRHALTCTTGDATIVEIRTPRATAAVVVQVYSCVFIIWSTGTHGTSLLQLARAAAGQVDKQSSTQAQDYFGSVTQYVRSLTPHPRGMPLSKEGHEAPRFTALIRSFSFDALRLMLTLLLSECSIVFVASSSSVLADCCCALRAFLYPFQWMHGFVPLSALYDRNALKCLLGDPSGDPFIGGVFTAERPLLMMLATTTKSRDSKLWIADCTSGSVLPARYQRTVYTLPPSQTLRDALSPSGSPAQVYSSVLQYWVRHCVGEYRKAPNDPYSFMFPSVPSSDRSALINQIVKTKVFRGLLERSDDPSLKPFNEECAKQFPELYSQTSKSSGFKNFFATKTRQLKSWSQGVSGYYPRYTASPSSDEHPTRADFDAVGRLPLDVFNDFEDFHDLLQVPTASTKPKVASPQCTPEAPALIMTDPDPPHQTLPPRKQPQEQPTPTPTEVEPVVSTKRDVLDDFLATCPKKTPESSHDRHKAALDLSHFKS